MGLQFSTQVRNALLDIVESTIGASAVLRIYTGTKPTNCAAANSGTLLAQATLPADWLAAASAGTKSKLGTWEDASANADGEAGHFRIYESTAATCHIQGSVTATGGTGDMTIDDVNIEVGKDVLVTGFTLTAPGA